MTASKSTPRAARAGKGPSKTGKRQPKPVKRQTATVKRQPATVPKAAPLQVVRPARPVLRGREAWSGAGGVAAVVVLLVQLVWRAIYLSRGFFTQDDFLMLHLGGTRRLGATYLFQDYSGHVFPGGFLIAYLQAHLAPLSWPAAYLPVLGMQLAAGVLTWLVLSRLLGDRWERIPLLTLFCLSPLTLWSTQWWAVAIQFLPLELGALGAALAYLCWRQDGWVWGRRLTFACTAGAMLFEERAILIPLVVFAVAAQIERAAGPRRRLTDALRTDRRLWAGLAGIVGAYLLLHLWLAPVHGAGGGGANESLDLVTNFVFRNVVPGSFGGPWTGVVFSGSAVIPPGWVIVVSCALLLLLVGYTVRFGGTTARASWLVLLAYVLADSVLVFAGRAQYGSFSGLTPRYAADMLPVLAIALAGAVRDVDPPTRVARLLTAPGPVDRRTLACLAIAVVYAVASGFTTHLVAPSLYNAHARTYVDNLRHDLREQPAVTLYDGTVPDDIMINWFGEDDRVSTVIAIAPEHPRFDEPSDQMRMVDDAGHLRSIALADPISGYAGPSTQCGYNVTLNSTLVYMHGAVPLAKNVLQLGYYTNVDDTAIVTAGSQTVDVPVHPGLHDVDAVVDSGFASFSIRLARTAGTLCLVSVDAGTPQPAAP